MTILLTGTTGYIGKRLLPVLLNQGYEVVCCVRDIQKFSPAKAIRDKIKIIENDLTDKDSLENIPENIDVAFYLVHSMSVSRDYSKLEQESAENFREICDRRGIKQVVYLSGIVNADKLSRHLSSRKTVERELGKGAYALTVVKAGIIIGSGSASFEIIRDLVEKLPLMVAPKWLNTRCQPIGISDVISILTGVINNQDSYNKSFDIGGREILTYKQMLLSFAEVRKLRRYIFTVPVMTPRLSSYWLYFVTSTSYKLASSLVDSMKIEVIAKDDKLVNMLGLDTLSYKESIRRAFLRIEQNEIVSSWKDSTISGRLDYKVSDYINVPSYGCFRDFRTRVVQDRDAALNRIWQIGGNTGWYYANWLWQVRGVLDKLSGGVGLRRGRTNPVEIHTGDTLDFWRVLFADREEGRLLLFAEMKLPGEAWLEFRLEGNKLHQEATFRPRGLLGRLYWFSVLPFHSILFGGMIKRISG